MSGFGAFTPETFPLYQTTTHTSRISSPALTPICLFVGGAGSLYTNPERTETLADGKDFPEAIRPLAQAMKKALGYLRTRNDVRWTYIEPAAVFLADGPRTGSYELTGEDFTVNKDGKSEISYATTRSRWWMRLSAEITSANWDFGPLGLKSPPSPRAVTASGVMRDA
ncbi:MAG: hypothetical protein V8S69_00455 [Dakarella massiliensis]